MGETNTKSKCCLDIMQVLPKDVWEEARKEVLDSGNQSRWSMCLEAIRILSEFWESEHDDWEVI